MVQDSQDLEVELTEHREKAVIKGKTSIPFERLVKLILQRKVFALFKQWGKEHIILDSDLLTDLASAAQDSRDDYRHLVMVTLGVGILGGIFLLSLTQFFLTFFSFYFTQEHYLFILIGFVVLVLITSSLARMQRHKKSDKLVEAL